jgi:hypothetical protein
MKRIVYIISLLSILCGCNSRPSMVEQRREEIRRNDSTELAQARVAVEEAERNVKQLEIMVATLKEKFVHEKVEKYQTQGYWVLPAYKGSKERFTFFPEVEESGKMLLVSIDKQRRYSFTEIDLEGEDYATQLPQGLTRQQRQDVDDCYAFAKTMKTLDDMRKRREKMLLKVRFYEKKMQRDQQSNEGKDLNPT